MIFNKFIIGSAATAVVFCYTYLGEPTIKTDFDKSMAQTRAPKEMSFDYYQIVANENTHVFEQINIIHKFASSILDNIKELEPEFSKTVDDNFWDLL
jgi:hypothetical protein